MPRIRTIKPEFWRNEDLSAISPEAALLAIGLLNYCDDEGYFNANAKLIESDVFPLRELSGSCPALIDELHRIGYLAFFSASDGKRYGQIVNFEKHQVINKKNISRIRPLIDLPEDYGSCPVMVEVGKERKGMEQGKEQGKEVTTRFDAKQYLMGMGVNEQTYGDWIQFRKTKRANVSKTAIDELAKEASKAGIDLESVLKECCARGWTGFKAEWVKDKAEPFSVGASTRKILERELEKEARFINPWDVKEIQ
jgi:hypothetical protein